ncbi:mucin-2-like [Patiria miniata]|uniref:Uncharacterized protein n=1 Tax=Patiria miniata TaxID=46514 RepID=A0A913Z7F2_PATMI|nr:mucin-2-like [Patiria miniata]
MKSNTASALTWILGIINLSCIVGLASSKSIVTPNGVIPSTAQLTTDLTDTTTVESGLNTVDRDITTTEIPLTSESSDDAAELFTTAIPDESPTPPTPTKQALTTLATPKEGSAILLPTVKTTLKATGTTTQKPSKQTPPQKPSKSPVATAPAKREEVITTTVEAHTTLLQTTTVSTMTPILTTTKRTTTTRVATTEPKIATQKPEPVVATTNKPTELNVVPTTLLAKTAAPVQPVVSTKVPITEGHKPVNTDGSQPKGTTKTHVLTSSEPDLGTGTEKTDTANNSVFSKLMLPVVLGIVAAILIICFAYGIRACKKKERNEGRRKLLHNGKDHEMKGNFDRMKLLADSSEDEF